MVASGIVHCKQREMHTTAFISCQVLFTLLDSHLSNIQQQSAGYVYDILDVGSQDTNGNHLDCISGTPFHINYNYNYVGIDFNISAANVHIARGEENSWPFYVGILILYCILQRSFSLTSFEFGHSLKEEKFLRNSISSLHQIHLNMMTSSGKPS